MAFVVVVAKGAVVVFIVVKGAVVVFIVVKGGVVVVVIVELNKLNKFALLLYSVSINEFFTGSHADSVVVIVVGITCVVR